MLIPGGIGGIKRTRRVARLIAEIDVLQGLVDLQPAGDSDCGLEVVAFLAGNAQLVALNRCLNV